ncbi:hypothetical protein C6500_06480 [Candidatus Poribacteria bacterium]|nr:MAG: hypothetical protein C6500_06480 [Candidatus Poribacteria bacterium]
MSKSVKLRVPFAFDDEKRLYDPQTAEKGKHYFCPSCQDTVILRKGEIKTAHFAHKASETCNQETILHKTAKQRIVEVISDWKVGKIDPPILKRVCEICRKSIDQSLPDKVERAILEYRMSNGFIVDIALMVENKPAAAIEIGVTHAVDENKASLLPVPFIELEGQKVIESPTTFEPIQDYFLPFTCGTCKQAKARFHVKVNEIAKQTGIKLPDRYYRYGFCECWRCRREIIVYAWPKASEWDNSAPKMKPMPQTIQYRYSNTVGGRYWVNTCPRCKSIQGDFFLFFGSDGPFFGTHCKGNSQDAYNRDMENIINYAVYNGMLREG